MATITKPVEDTETPARATRRVASATRTQPTSAIPVFNLGVEMTSAFAKYQTAVYHSFTAILVSDTIAGGIPVDDNVVESWLATKLGVPKDDLLRQAVADTMVETKVGAEEATKSVAALKHLNRFKRQRCAQCPLLGPYCDTRKHNLMVEGRQLKACLKEAASIAVDTGVLDKARGYGLNNKKGLLSYFAETVFVEEDDLPMQVTVGDQWVPALEATGINQRFVHTFRGSGIQYEEVIRGARIDFTVRTIHDYADEEWAGIWLTAEQNGLGASRSQGYGRFKLVHWQRLN